MKKILLTISALFFIGTGGIAQKPQTPGSNISGQAAKKLDSQIILALKQERKLPPFDKPTSIRPYIPIREGNLILIDLDATVSEELKKQIVNVGGELMPSPSPDHIIRAMLPLGRLEALAERRDIRSIKPAWLSVSREIKPAQQTINNHQR